FGNSCVDGTIAAYLKDGSVPGRVKANTSDRKCRPLAPPEPSAVDGSAAGKKAAPLSRADLQQFVGR
ncbi:MAG TPA: alpha/beta hydrolase, partial [Actinoplanes sp.]|nr:alpha/beta hydrolase [Actinoplanes sp.]